MWGKVENKKIVKIYKYPEIIKDVSGTQYPSSIFQNNTRLKDFYIYPVVSTNSEPKNAKLYSAVTESFAWNESKSQIDKTYNFSAKEIEDTNAKDEDGKDIKDEDGNIIVNDGIKTILKKQVKAIQSSLLATTDKWVIRKSETGDDIPSEVSKYRDAIRASAKTMETAIDGIKSISNANTLLTPTLNSDSSIKSNAILFDFPEASKDMPE